MTSWTSPSRAWLMAIYHCEGCGLTLSLFPNYRFLSLPDRAAIIFRHKVLHHNLRSLKFYCRPTWPSFKAKPWQRLFHDGNLCCIKIHTLLFVIRKPVQDFTIGSFFDTSLMAFSQCKWACLSLKFPFPDFFWFRIALSIPEEKKLESRSINGSGENKHKAKHGFCR